jgi:hypothetical protein
MTGEVGELEKVSTTVSGVIRCLDWDRMAGAHIETRRSIEDCFWKLAMKAGYHIGDRVEYNVSIKKKT